MFYVVVFGRHLHNFHQYFTFQVVFKAFCGKLCVICFFLCPLVMILFTIHGCIFFFLYLLSHGIEAYPCIQFIVGCGWGHEYLLHLISTCCHVHV